MTPSEFAQKLVNATVVWGTLGIDGEEVGVFTPAPLVALAEECIYQTKFAAAGQQGLKAMTESRDRVVRQQQTALEMEQAFNAECEADTLAFAAKCTDPAVGYAGFRDYRLSAEIARLQQSLSAIHALLPPEFQEKAQDPEYLHAYIECWRDDAEEFCKAAGKAENAFEALYKRLIEAHALLAQWQDPADGAKAALVVLNCAILDHGNTTDD